MIEVSIIKLITGTDVVGIITDSDETSLIISNPYEVVYDPNRDSLTFIPLSFWSYDKQFIIAHSHVLFRASCMPLLTKKYLNAIDKVSGDSETTYKDTEEMQSSVESLESIFYDNYEEEELEYDEFEVDINKESNTTLH